MEATKDAFDAVFTEIDAIQTQVTNISELLDEEQIAEILTKIAVLEEETGVIEEILASRLLRLEEKVEEIETTGRFKEIEISSTEPEDKTKDKLWLKIL
jgi:hypothetical protein